MEGGRPGGAGGREYRAARDEYNAKKKVFLNVSRATLGENLSGLRAADTVLARLLLGELLSEALEAHLSDTEWLAGDAYSLADIARAREINCAISMNDICRAISSGQQILSP